MTTLPAGVTFRIANQGWEPEELVHTTETPGGLKECTFSLPSSGRDIEWDDQLVIHDSVYGAYPFIGTISDIHKTGLCYDFKAVRGTRLQSLESTTGPGNPTHPSGIYAGRIYKAGTLMQQTITDALQLCEVVFSGTIVTLGLQYVADTQNMGGYTPEQMWNYVAALLASLDTPLLWHVRGRNGVQVVDMEYQDTAARYRVELDEEQIDEHYDAEQAITRSLIEWGNDQVYGLSLPGVSWARRKLIHNKYLNATRDITRLGDAQGLAGAHLARFGKFRATQTTLTLKCGEDVVEAKPPVGDSNNWPLHLVESGHGIQLLNRPVSEYPYNENLKYIVGTSYTWDEGTLVLDCGDSIRNLAGDVQQIIDYNVNRLFSGPYNGPPGGNHPLADADLLPLVGPEIDGSVPPSTSYAIGAFKGALTEGDPEVKYGKQLDPDIVPDEGLEANVQFDPATSGFQAAVRTTPGTYSEYRLLLGDSTGLINDTVLGEFYRVIPPSEGGGTQFLFSFTSGGLKDRGAIAMPTSIVLQRGDYAMIKVTTIGTTATWGAISLHAKKNFPRLKS